MPYCYACRNSKPATHAHFTDHGILALRPPKRHITEIEEQWDSMTDEARAQALEAGRQFLARAETDAPARADRASTSRSTSNTGASRASGARRTRQQAQEGEGSPWRLVGIGAVVLGAIGWLYWQARRIAA